MTTPTPSSTRDNLIKARALIDTPEKWAMVSGIITAVAEATRSTPERAAAIAALRKQGLRGSEPLLIVLAAFDRAIASQEKQS